MPYDLIQIMTRLSNHAFSIDVEDFFQVSALESVICREDWDSIAPRVVQTMSRILGLLGAKYVSATFSVLGWVAERIPALVRKISSAGHEVACHGYSQRRIYAQSRETFEVETLRAKSILEDCIGKSVISYRAASFSITRDSLGALDIIVEAGFAYDSSTYPVWHDN